MSAGSEGTKGKAHFYTERLPLFPVLHQMHCTWPPRLAFAAAIFQAFQLLGFVINTVNDHKGYSWGPTMEIPRKAIFFTHFPIWEPTFIAETTRKVPCMIAFWAIFVAMNTAAAILSVVLRDRGQGQVPSRLVSYCKHLLNVVSTALFFPIAHVMLSFMVCARDGEGVQRPRAYPDEKCWSSWHLLHFVCGVIVLLILVLFAYMSSVMLFTLTPNIPQVDLARGHSQFDELFLLARIVLVVLFHIFLSRGSPDGGESEFMGLFAFVLCGMCLYFCVHLTVQLPFYNLVVTRVHVAFLAAIAFNALVAGLKPYLGRTFVEDSYGTVTFVLGSIAFFLGGYYISNIRVSATQHAFDSIVSKGNFEQLKVLNANPQYPAHLPEADLALCKCSHHAEEMAAEAEHEEEDFTARGESEKESTSRSGQACGQMRNARTQWPLEVVGSYLSAIYISTDIEVSSRILRSYVMASQTACSSPMLRYSSRLFTKGILKFHSDTMVQLHLVSFLTYFAGAVGIPGVAPSLTRIRAALSETETIMASEATLVTLYQNHLIQILMKPLIGLTNDSHRKIVTAALKTYKDILSQMAMFWNKLLVSENVNTVQLGIIANSVTGRRGEGLHLFGKALLHPTYSLIRKYAQFLRYVMIDEDSAHTIEQKLSHLQREEKTMSSQTQGTQNTLAFTMGDFVEAELQTNKAGNTGMEGLPDSHRGSSTIRRLAFTMNLMFSLVVIVLIGFFIVEASLGSSRSHFVAQVEAAGISRALGMQCAVLVQQVVSLKAHGASSGSDPATLGKLKLELKSVAEQFITLHYKLSHGSLKSTFAKQEDYYKKDSCEMIDELRFDDSHDYAAGNTRTLVPLWVLGNQYGSAVLAIANSQEGVASSAASIAQPMRQSDVNFVLNNAHATLAPALNRSMEFYSDAHDESEEMYMWILAGLFTVSLLLVFCVYLTMVINFQKVGASKLDTLNLFTYIPHVHVKMLAEEARVRLASCEEEREDSYELFNTNGKTELEAEAQEARSEEKKHSVDNIHAAEEGGGEHGEHGKEPDAKLENHDRELKEVVTADPSGEESRCEEFSEAVTANASEKETEDGSGPQGRMKVNPDEESWLGGMGVYLRSLCFLVCVFTVVSVSVSMVPLMAIVRERVESKRETFKETEREKTLLSAYAHDIYSMSHAAELFHATGEDYYLESYWRRGHELRLEKTHEHLVLYSEDRELSRLYLKVASTLESLKRDQRIAIALATNAYFGSDEAKLPFLNLVSDLVWNETAPDTGGIVTYKGQALRAPVNHLSTWQEDLNKTATEQMDLARSVLYSDQYRFDMRTAMEKLASASGGEAAANEWALQQDDPLSRAIIVLVAVQLLALLGLLFLAYHHEPKVYSFQVLVSLYIVCVAAVLALTVLIREEWEDAERVSVEKGRLVRIMDQTRTAVSKAGNSARAFVQFGDPQHLEDYSSHVEAPDLDATVHSALELDPDLDFSGLEEGYEYLAFMRECERIALARGTSVFGTLTVGANRSLEWLKFQNYSYNILKQGKLQIEQVQEYGIPGRSNATSLREHRMYANSADDSMLPLDEQLRIARGVVSGLKYEQFVGKTESKFMAALRSLFSERSDSLDDSLSKADTFATVGLIVELVVLALFFAYSVVYLVKFMSTSDTQHAEFFPVLMRNCRLSLALLAVLICMSYGLTFLNRHNTRDIIKHTDIVSKREWLIAQSMFFARNLQGDDGEGGGLTRIEHFEWKNKLKDTMQTLLNNRIEFSDMAGLSAALDEENYGLTTTGQATKMIAGEGTATCQPVEHDEASTRLLTARRGIELATWGWAGQMNALGHVFDVEHTQVSQMSTANQGLFQRTKAYLEEVEVPLFTASMEASKLQVTHAEKTISDASLLLFLLLVLVVFVTLTIYLVVFRSMVRLLKNEEEGTKLMLTMIPQEVRETAPAIAEYLSTGVITLNDKIEEANEWIVEYAAVPSIVIDHVGTVQRFSRAARETFGYELEEVIGKNIKMLMPERFAVEHDEYLAAYRKTGIRRIIGNVGRKASALQKSGNTFDCKITVHEVRKSGREPIYVGTVIDITELITLERQLMVGETVVRYSHNPIIIVNRTGTVTSTSDSAKTIFGMKIGDDVKKVVPEEIAVNHDYYMSRYLQTREKHIIGKLLRTEALLPGATGLTSQHQSQQTARTSHTNMTGVTTDLTRDDDDHVMQVELMVDEYKDEDGEVEGFVGYLRDLTEENQIKYACAVSESIMKVSPNPVVSMTQQGIINRWNQQAEQSFGVPYDKAIGQNVVLIIPPDIAVHHDGYLSKYLRTGEKKMINQVRKVEAKRSSGELFPAEVSIREVGSSYVAYIRETSMEEQMHEAVHLQKETMQNTTCAVIIVTERGIVQGYNPAAQSLFLYSSSEVTGQNINMLMPEEVARLHNGYLSRYRDTGIKKVIGARTEVNGKRKDGVLLTLHIYVLEIELSDKKRLYVGSVIDISEEKAILRMNKTNNAIVKMIASSVITTTSSGLVQLFNVAAERMFGWQASDIIGRNVSLLQPDATAAKHDSFLNSYKRTGKQNVVDARRVLTCRKKNGSLFSAEIILKEIKVNGAETMFMASFRDTTFDRKLQNLQSRLDVVMKNNQIMLITITSAGKLLSINSCVEKTLGYSEADVLDKNVKMFLPDEIARKHDSFLSAYMRTGVKHVINKTIQSHMKKDDESLIPVEVQIKEIKQGNRYTFLAYVKDKLSTQAVELNTTLKDTLIHRCPTPLVITDVYGTIMTWPPSAEKYTGWSSEELLGKNIKIIQPPKVAKVHDGYLKTYRKTGVKKVIDSVVGVSVRRKDKTVFPAQLSLREIDGDDGETLYVGSITSVEHSLEMAKKEKQGRVLLDLSIGAFVAITPMGLISLWNKAAQDIWGYTYEEVQDENVKLLMGEPHRTNHDQYLTNYRDTRTKKILDEKQTLPARRKDGNDVMVHLTVTVCPEKIEQHGTARITPPHRRSPLKARPSSWLRLSMQQRMFRGLRYVRQPCPLPLHANSRRTRKSLT